MISAGARRFETWLVCMACFLGLFLGADARAATLELSQAQATIMVDGSVEQRDVVLPYHWDRLHHAHAGEAVFELRFPLAVESAEPYGIYISRIGNTADIWLNGGLLARLGDVAHFNGDDYGKAPQYVSIPVQLLRKDNVLRVHIRADAGRRGGLSSVVVGPNKEVGREYEQTYRWRVSVSLVITILSLLVGAVAMVLWITQSDSGDRWVNRRDTIYLSASLAELCWALRVGDVAIQRPPLPWPWWGVVMTAAFAGWICCIALFCHHVAGWHRHRSMPAMRTALWGLFGTSIVASTLSFTLHQPAFLTAWLGFANLFFIGYATLYLVAAFRRPQPAHLLLATVGAINVAMGVRDWLTIRISGSYAESTWIRYSSVLFGLTLGYIVLTRFRAASAQAQDLFTNMSAKVAEKEQALTESYQRLEQLAREQERASERTRILRDMHDGVGSHISSAIRQLLSGKASNSEVLLTLRDSLDQLKLSIDAMNLPSGDITALLANLRYRLEPRFAASDIELQWDVDLLPALERLDGNAMRQLQFMVFEALSNVLQHAHAGVLRIEAHSVPGDGALLRVIDNGCGFDVERVQRKGLTSLRERAAAIGARLNVSSAPGRTVVEIGFE